jgi:hypothetical protein
MERRRCSVLGVVLLGALGLSAAACGFGKKDEEKPATVDTPATTGVVVEATAPPAITVPPPTPPVVPPPAPTPAKTAEVKSDPMADARSIAACCTAIRREAGKLKGPEKDKMLAVRSTCNDLTARVRNGESPRDKAMSAIKAAGAGAGKLPRECT